MKKGQESNPAPDEEDEGFLDQVKRLTTLARNASQEAGEYACRIKNRELRNKASKLIRSII